VLVLNFVEQPNILDRDHRLIGEGLDQLDFLIGEWSYRRSGQIEHADRDALPQQWYAEDGANAATALDGLVPGVFRIGADIGDMNGSAFNRRSPDQRVAARFD